MNLPNALTVCRILAAPLIATLPFMGAWPLKLFGFVLYLAAAITDYYDGVLARTHGLVTDLGKVLDPLADKLLLVATLIPMYVLMTVSGDWPARHLGGLLEGIDSAFEFPFVTPLGRVALPFWVIAVVVGRELFMTLFRQYAIRRGTVIDAIGPAKWKTAMQSVWVGAAYFWFAAATASLRHGWAGAWWSTLANFIGIVGTVSMIAAFVLTLYSLALYLRRYGFLLARHTDA